MKRWLILIVVLSAFLRLYRLDELATFNYDEARDAVAEYQLLHGHLTLLGPDSRIGNAVIYFGPWHYYLMAPALALANYDPLGPYVWTAVLGVVTTALIFVLTKSYLAAAFYAVFPLSVAFNRWAWNPNTVPLMATLFLICFLRRRYLFAGLFLGLAIQLHPSSILLASIPLILVWRRNLRRQAISFLLVGTLLGLLPIIIFELKHQFLYSRSFLSLFGANWAYRQFNWHYFLWLLPILAWSLEYLPKKISLTLVSLSLITSLYWLRTQVPNRAENPGTIRTVASLIAADTKSSLLPFNVASFVDPDTRATAYRYFLLLAGVAPLGVEEYGVVDHLYVITFESPNRVLYNQTYEIASLHPKRILKSWKIGNEYLYRLERN